MTVTRIEVPTAARYDVLVGRNLIDAELPGLLGDGVRRVGIVHPETVDGVASQVEKALRTPGYQTYRLPVPDAEAAKTVDTAAWCWQRLGEWGFTRSDALVGVGGGATTDLAGFIAATWLRGVRVVHVPTTVLGMVDAAVGGKTGINTGAGKNLVGAFHEPAGVLCDLSTLDLLPAAEYVTGLAEVVKCGFIADARIIDLIEARPERAVVAGGELGHELISRAVRVKASVVAEDLTETAATTAGPDGGIGREVLNYGHTLGHAVERVEEYRWRHGAAVCVGMVFVAELARLGGYLDDTTADRHRAVLSALGLPTSYRSGVWPELVEAMKVDKKTRGDVLRFVILRGMVKPTVLEGPDTRLLTAAYERLTVP